MAAPFLADARLVDEALAMREPADRRSERPRPTAAVLWKEAAGNEHRYLELMEEHGHLRLATTRVS